MFNLVEMCFDEQKAAPCVHGNIVLGHACYCHADTPDTPRKCHIWRWHAEEQKHWFKRKNPDFDPDKGCSFFQKNKDYKP